MNRIYVLPAQVRFRDTDAAGIMHFSAFMTYMEDAEHAFLRSLGLSVCMPKGDWSLSWPRVSVKCDYQGSLRFEQAFEVHVSVKRLGGKSVTYGFQFVAAHQPVAHGEITAVCCRIEKGQAPKSIAIPDEFRSALAGFVEETSA